MAMPGAVIAISTQLSLVALPLRLLLRHATSTQLPLLLLPLRLLFRQIRPSPDTTIASLAR